MPAPRVERPTVADNLRADRGLTPRATLAVAAPVIVGLSVVASVKRLAAHPAGGVALPSLLGGFRR